MLRGEWEVLGVVRTDMERPDWFRDPVTGRRSAPDRYAFRIDHRSEEQTGNVKQVWEISRLQHLTLLATAWSLTRDERYARRVAEQLRSWWQENPFLSGIHWTNGIELGIRLISLAWIRRLLDDWPGVGDLFERNGLAVRQIQWHQQYLAALRSRGSSANNHVVAEAAGQLVASCAFPWFPESDRWRRTSARLLERELLRNTFPSGINRELASDYHCFVAELGFLAAVEAEVSGHPLSPAAWQRLGAMADSAAALLDERMRPPRQGDSDEGRALLLDAPTPNSWPSLLALADALVGRLDWWPRPPADAGSAIIGALMPARRQIEGRPAQRPSRFADAGITLLRTTGEQEIWCRCDGGPHGFLSIAAHAHADALSVEVRYAGVDILADPGTYCYHGERAWRSYFRSTIAHNTAETRRPELTPPTAVRSCGYGMRTPGRSRSSTTATSRDGPPSTAATPRSTRRRCIAVRCCWTGRRAASTSSTRSRAAATTSAWPSTSALTSRWSSASPVPSWAGPRRPRQGRPGWNCRSGCSGACTAARPTPFSAGTPRAWDAASLPSAWWAADVDVAGAPLATRLEFLELGNSSETTASRRTVSWCASSARPGKAPEIQAEAR